MYTELAKGFRCFRAKSQEFLGNGEPSGDHDKLSNESRERFEVLLDAAVNYSFRIWGLLP